ncbi:putative late blight resistance protein homolog R1B-16 [Salvia hispanica]|uniref:putative late blight resistance protein homolog R1B-16 n=1 Tax=Salvia hispanica TaxID=49212 RepID=UPI002009C199|nr:putative late blight resistance protein homolog R1B-16 [Salvia hispanica]
MAYTVVGSLTQTIPRILSEDEQYPISDEGKQLIDSLSNKVAPMRKFLAGSKEEAEGEAMSLETRMRETANRAEDVLEHFMYEHLKVVRSKAVVERTDAIQYDFRELQIVMEEINSIAQEVERIQPEIMQHDGRPTTQPGVIPSSETKPPVIDNATVGLEEQVKKIKGLLCGGSLERQVIPITGMGGIGKTTLARAVYEDQEVVKKFDVWAWIVVSQNYRIENVFEKLASALETQVEKGVVNDGDTVEEKLHRILSLKKYLIVVDDLWSAKAWDSIRKGFGNQDKKDGSRIMVTTRDEDVAAHASGSKQSHKMDLMDDPTSWELLKLKVSPNTQLKPDMEIIARDVAKDCGGLPLAIVLIAGILSTAEKSPVSWGKIAEDVKNAVESDKEFGQRIALSYTHLPFQLRPCFLYMGGFPEDHEIQISKLFKLWIAEGFVKDEKDAEVHLYNLVKRNLPLITAFKSSGNFKTCTIHDMVREMSKSKAIDENYERRMSIGHPDLTGLARGYASTLRSVICFQPNDSSLRSLRKFKLLRVLDVVDTDAYSLPTSVFDLFHLRYLAFGCPMEVPSAISRLQNLRSLIIHPSKRSKKYSTDEVCLPVEIWMMPLLTHLVSFFDLFPNPEGAASALKNLLSLSVVKKLICTEEMMKLICNVKKLSVTYFGHMYKEDYKLNNLVLLTQLENLTLAVKKGSPFQLKAKPVFPETLKELTLSGWRFPWKDMKSIAALPHLQVLKLRDHAFEGSTWDTIGDNSEECDEEGNAIEDIDEECEDDLNTAEDTNEECYTFEDMMNEENRNEDYKETENKLFLELKYLLIEESDLENWVTKKEHFPALERLVLKDCGKLKEIPNDIGDIPRLKLIEIDRFNESLLNCVYEIQKHQKKNLGKNIIVKKL